MPDEQNAVNWWATYKDSPAERATAWLVKIFIGGIATYLATTARNWWQARAQQRAVAAEILAPPENDNGEKLRDMVIETREQVKANASLRIEQDHQTQRQMDYFQSDLQDLRRQVACDMSALRREQSEREERQEHRIGSLIEEIRTFVFTFPGNAKRKDR